MQIPRKTRKISIILFIVLTLFCEDKKIITKDILVQNKWVTEAEALTPQGYSFAFNNNYEVEYNYCCESESRSGTFKIENNKLFNSYTKACSFNDCSQLNEQEKCSLEEIKDSLLYFEALKCGNAFAYNVSAKPPEGSERTIDGIKVILLGGLSGVTTDAVKVRKKPDTNAELELNDPNMKFLPKNYKIKVFSRTKEKVKVDKWDNYWYYIELEQQNAVTMTGTLFIRGWAYGQFIKVQNIAVP